MVSVERSTDCGNSPRNTTAEEIGLAFCGAVEMPAGMMSDTTLWRCADGSELVGDHAVEEGLDALTPPRRVVVDSVVTHGRAGAVSGRIEPARGKTHLFCHVLRFTSASGRSLAEVTTFERPV